MSWGQAKWVVDQIVQKIPSVTGQQPNNMRSFTAFSINGSTIGLRFQEPADSVDSSGNILCTVGGVMIRMSDKGYPTSPEDGTEVINNTDLGKYVNTPFEVSGLTKGTTYYFSAFPYSSQGVYNLSKNNRASAFPADGEIASVSIEIDDVSGFGGVTVKMVDETNADSSQTTTLTSASKTATFTVPIGDTYHIEFGASTNYSQTVTTTESRVSVAGTTKEYSSSYHYWTATITVTYPAGGTLTCSNGTATYTAADSSGTYTFKVHSAGEWTLTLSDETHTATGSVEVTVDGDAKSIELSYVKIYGISRSTSATSTAWTRTDDAVGKTATASVGTVAGKSDFDNCYPWSEMKRETLSTGDVMVKVPKFYFRRYIENSVEYIKIADKPTTGFALHPAFQHNGAEQDYIYVGAYETGSGHVSKSGVAPLVSQTRAQFRAGAKAKGTGWSSFDFSSKMAVDMLYLVEFADSNSQAKVGRGYCDGNNAAISTGSCDNVPNLTGRPAGTDGKTGVVYRGIENYWGNIWEWFDGLNANGNTEYICNNQNSYADDTSTGYTQLSFSGANSNNYISAEGLDPNHPAYMIPTAVAGSETTGFADYYYQNTGWRVAYRSGGWDAGSYCGVFYLFLNDPSSGSYGNVSSRLLKLPA